MYPPSQKNVAQDSKHKKKFFIEILFLSVIIVVSLLPRAYLLDSLPNGLHNDEGWTGIDAKNILQNGYIDAYVGSATGQPTLPLYLTALVFKFIGDSIFSLRLSMVIYSVLGVLFFYYYLRQKSTFSHWICIFSSFIFSNSLIFLHFSRIGFMLISSIPSILSVFITYDKFTQNRKIIWLVLSGICIGLMINTYNSMLVPGLFFVSLFFIQIFRGDGNKNIKIFLRKLTIFSIFMFCIYLSSWGLINQMLRDPAWYFGHHRGVSIWMTEKNTKLNNTEKSKLLINNIYLKVHNYFTGKLTDGVDGFGGIYSFSFYELVFIVLGFIFFIVQIIYKGTLWSLFDNPYTIHFLIICIGLIASGTTIDGHYRRAIYILPSVYMLITLALETVFKHIQIAKTWLTWFQSTNVNRRLELQVAAMIITKSNIVFPRLILISLTILIVFTNIYTYFLIFPKNEESIYVFAGQVVIPLEKVKKIVGKADTILLLHSSEIPCEHESIRFLLPSNIHCINIYPFPLIEQVKKYKAGNINSRVALIITGSMSEVDGSIYINDKLVPRDNNINLLSCVKNIPILRSNSHKLRGTYCVIN